MVLNLEKFLSCNSKKIKIISFLLSKKIKPWKSSYNIFIKKKYKIFLVNLKQPSQYFTKNIIILLIAIVYNKELILKLTNIATNKFISISNSFPDPKYINPKFEANNEQITYLKIERHLNFYRWLPHMLISRKYLIE